MVNDIFVDRVRDDVIGMMTQSYLSHSSATSANQSNVKLNCRKNGREWIKSVYGIVTICGRVSVIKVLNFKLFFSPFDSSKSRFAIHFRSLWIDLTFALTRFAFSISWISSRDFHSSLCIGHDILCLALKLTWKWLDLCSHQPSFSFFPPSLFSIFFFSSDLRLSGSAVGRKHENNLSTRCRRRYDEESGAIWWANASRCWHRHY